MRIIMGNSGNVIQSCAVGVRRIVAQGAQYIKGKTGQTHHFWRGNFCGVVTDFFLVCVLQKFALDFFLQHRYNCNFT